MPIDWTHVIDSACGAAVVIVPAAIGGIVSLRKLKQGQDRIEKKADGNHEIALKAIKAKGKYEGLKEAKNDSRKDQEQILEAVKQVLASQKRRGQRKTDK